MTPPSHMQATVPRRRPSALTASAALSRAKTRRRKGRNQPRGRRFVVGRYWSAFAPLRLCATIPSRAGPLSVTASVPSLVVYYLSTSPNGEKTRPLVLTERVGWACQVRETRPDPAARRRATGDGRRATGDGRRATGDGRRATGDGRRATGDGGHRNPTTSTTSLSQVTAWPPRSKMPQSVPPPVRVPTLVTNVSPHPNSM